MVHSWTRWLYLIKVVVNYVSCSGPGLDTLPIHNLLLVFLFFLCVCVCLLNLTIVKGVPLSRSKASSECVPVFKSLHALKLPPAIKSFRLASFLLRSSFGLFIFLCPPVLFRKFGCVSHWWQMRNRGYFHTVTFSSPWTACCERAKWLAGRKRLLTG